MPNRYEPSQIMHRVVEHNGVLYFGGTTAADKTLDIGGQTQQTLERIGALLEQYGSSKEKVLAATIFVTSLSGKDAMNKDAMNKEWVSFFGKDHLPARATVGVAELGPGTLIEIVITAAR